MTTPARLTQGSVARTLVKLSAPMVGGLFSVIAFNLGDTYFVSQLGTRELAAMSFTFPVVMVMMGIAMGLGTATISVVSRAIGNGDQTQIRRLSSDSLMLSFLTVLVFAAVGMVTIDPLFLLMGATPELLPLIRDYMLIWYPGMVCLVIPMVANSAIRSTGDTTFPALVMVGATGLNFVLDPLFIFGLWGFPRWELEGAAFATVLARATTLVASLLILHFRERLLDFKVPHLHEVWQSWKQIGGLAIPVAATNMMQPIGLGVVTRLIASYGPSSVAAWGAGSRVTAFALTPVFAVCSGLVPFVGQNWGAGEFARVQKGRNYAYGFAIFWSVLAVLALRFLTDPIARFFSLEPDVVAEMARYLWIIPFGYFGVGVFNVTEETLNAIGRPVMASIQTIIHMFMLYIPLAFVGSHYLSMDGLFFGLVSADLVGGAIGVLIAWWMCRREHIRTDQIVEAV
jgi:putative MATE family efflux protein